MDNVIPMTTEQTPQTGMPTAGSSQLALNDLAAVVQIIDIVSRRGAFEGTELTAIGALRTRFADFLKASTPKQEDPAAQMIEPKA